MIDDDDHDDGGSLDGGHDNDADNDATDGGGDDVEDANGVGDGDLYEMYFLWCKFVFG